jgi:Xaa-Pro aminopeptidase
MAQESSLAHMYRRRRLQLAEQLGEGLAVIQSAGPAPDPSLHDRNLFYLTGLRSRQAVLILAPEGIVVDRWETINGPEVGRGHRVSEALFVEERKGVEKALDGAGPSFADLTASTGVEHIYGLDLLNSTLDRALMREKVLWLNTPGTPSLDKPVPAEITNINHIHDRFYWLRLENLAPKIHEMRRIKESYEIDCLRRAFAAQAQIFEKIMRTLKPGENESLGQAIFDYEARILPAEFSAGMDDYEGSIIVGAGKNAAIGHYMANNQPIQDGDLVLIDAGISCEGYSSDISSTFPANGRFSPRQRQLYEVVLEAQKRAIATMRPGSSDLVAHKAVYEVFEAHGVAQYGYGTCGHPVGLNIHDPVGQPDIPYEPGVVLVIEPWLSMPDEGLGIRIESGVLITEDGCELLPEPAKEVDQVEAVCQGD